MSDNRRRRRRWWWWCEIKSLWWKDEICWVNINCLERIERRIIEASCKSSSSPSTKSEESSHSTRLPSFILHTLKRIFFAFLFSFFVFIKWMFILVSAVSSFVKSCRARCRKQNDNTSSKQNMMMKKVTRMEGDCNLSDDDWRTFVRTKNEKIIFTFNWSEQRHKRCRWEKSVFIDKKKDEREDRRVNYIVKEFFVCRNIMMMKLYTRCITDDTMTFLFVIKFKVNDLEFLKWILIESQTPRGDRFSFFIFFPT